MPVAPAIIAAIIGAAASTAGLGAELAGVGQPSTSISPAQKLATAKQNEKSTAATIANQIPNIEGQTGGSVSPQYAAKVAELISGASGASGAAENAGLAQIFGQMYGGEAPFSGGTTLTG